MPFDIDAPASLAPVDPFKSPKSCAFPGCDIVTKSMTLEAGYPPAIIPLVRDDGVSFLPLATLQSPKSDASPVLAILTKVIVFTFHYQPP